MLSGIAKLKDLELENQRVFVRANLDAPSDKLGTPTDPWLVDRLIPTLTLLAEKGARIIVGSRVGDARDGDLPLPNEKAPSIEPVAQMLAERGKLEVMVPDGATSEAVRKVVETLRPGRVCVLENLAREEDTGPGAAAFARYLAGQVDAYVGDSLRALAFDSATATMLPRLLEKKAPGLGLESELSAYARLRSQVDSPRLLIWGGNSLESRLEVLEPLLKTCDKVFFVGVPANTMLRALGHVLGATRLDANSLPLARSIREQLGARMLLPTDFVVGSGPRATTGEVRGAHALREHDAALDLGPATLDRLSREIQAARSVVWCGNLGLYHNAAFAQGTHRIAVDLARSGAFTVVAGDDSVAAARAMSADLGGTIQCLSEGGPASLTLLAGKKLAGLDALRGPIQ